MPRATFTQSNFNAGEWTPKAYGRFDIQKYRDALRKCLNYQPMQQGPLTRRPGAEFVELSKDQLSKVRLEKFEFSESQAYVLEFGGSYIRFFINDGQLQVSSVPAYNGATAYNIGDLVSSGGVNYYCVQSTTGNAPPNATYWYALTGTIYEIPSPYLSGELFDIQTTQIDDVLYIAHPNHPVYKLQRLGATDWTLSQVAFIDGPYETINTTPTTMLLSGPTGNITVQASGTQGVNGGLGFQATDVGRSIRVRFNTGATTTSNSNNALDNLFSVLNQTDTTLYAWVWGVITAVTDTTHVSVTLTDIPGSPVPVPATATAVVTGGAVSSINVIQSGEGYKNQTPSVIVVPHNSTPAVITATIGILGAITGLTLVSGGGGYAASTNLPLLIRSSTNGIPGNGASGYATTDASGIVTSVTLTSGGAGYQGATLSVYVVGGTAGSGATATASVSKSGSIESITVTNPGSGYTNGVDVYIDPPASRVIKATTAWQLGLWTSVNGYPSSIAVHQSRLCLGGSASNPTSVYASNSGDYENFAPTEFDGTVIDSDAFAFAVGSNTQNKIKWMVPDENGLLVGTAGSEALIAPSSLQQALTPTNVNVKPMSNYGSIGIPGVRVGKATLFVQRDSRKVRELYYQFTFNTFQANDISLVGEHLTLTGFIQMAAAFSPQQVVWFVRNDGTLIGLSYDKEQDVLGWHQHALGGYSDAAGLVAAKVESVCVIPNAASGYDEVWLAVQRYVNGTVQRSIEKLDSLWENGKLLVNANFLDSSVLVSRSGSWTYAGGIPTTISTLNFKDAYGAPAPHGLQTGDTLNVTLTGDFGTTTVSMAVTVLDSVTVTIPYTTPGNLLDAGNFVGNAGVVRGLTWLKGQTIGVLGDGAVLDDVTVDTSGVATFTNTASQLVLGFRYISQGQTMDIEAGGADGPSQGKQKRIHRVIFRFWQSCLLELESKDPTTGGFVPMPWQTDGFTLGNGSPLFTGDKRWTYEGDWDTEALVGWRTDEPLPSTIELIAVQLETNDDL